MNKKILVLLALFSFSCSKERTSVYNYEEYLAYLADKNVDKYIGIKPEREEKFGDWDVYYYGKDSQAICFAGDEFIVSVREADPNRVVLYLEGGGACWDYETCYETRLANVKAGVPGYGGLMFGGFMDKDKPDNPLKDWSIVYASYCDGSVWSGDNDVYYNGVLTKHHGLANLSAAVTLLKERFPSPEKILVTGSSAGGYGTLMGYLVTRSQFPELFLKVLNDSGAYIENPEDTYMHDAVRQNWKIEQYLPENCEGCDEQLIYILNWIFKRDPYVKWGLFSYYDDIVIGSIFLKLGPDFRKLLLDVTGDIHTENPDVFKRYFIEGSIHTIMELPTYYSVNVNGIYFYQWVDGLVNDTDNFKDLLE
jgi:hypothetical protein